ncbi:MAG: outer membrane beta-barrel protein [Acidobacteria bacterium]|nr:outer membrane beta-barrel protein [Acidobacteriota bacterium]
MKRKTIVMLSLLLVLGGWLPAREQTILKVKVQTANVRSEADATSPVIAKVTAGTLLEALGRDGAWFEVTVSNASGKEVNGYIHNSVVEMLGGDDEEEAPRPRAASRRTTPAPRASREMASGGVKLLGGLSMGNLTFSEELPATLKKSSLMGFMGGLGFESGGRIAIELDLLYSPGGTVLKNAQDPESKAKVTISGAAVTAPILLKVRFMPGTTPYILAGGEIGYVLNQKVVLTAADGTETEEDITENINRLLYGVVFGGGIELKSGGLNVLLEARYRLGLSNLIKEPEPGASIKATALSFLLGIKF